MGWNVIVVWECEISRKTAREERLWRLEQEINIACRKHEKVLEAEREATTDEDSGSREPLILSGYLRII